MYADFGLGETGIIADFLACPSLRVRERRLKAGRDVNRDAQSLTSPTFTSREVVTVCQHDDYKDDDRPRRSSAAPESDLQNLIPRCSPTERLHCKSITRGEMTHWPPSIVPDDRSFRGNCVSVAESRAAVERDSSLREIGIGSRDDDVHVTREETRDRRRGAYLHAPDRMAEDPGTILRGVGLLGPGLHEISGSRSVSSRSELRLDPRARRRRQDRVLRLAGVASPAAS